MAGEPSCEKCGAREKLRPDLNIEGLWFCAACWEERERTTRAMEAGLYDAQDEDG
jgi:hypothetical protein